MVTKPPSVLFITSEILGLAKTGGLADVALYLPQALQAANQETRVFVPFYQQILQNPNKATFKQMLLPTPVGYPDIEYQVWETVHETLTIYLIDCPHYFDRLSLYGEHNLGYADNGERFAFFCAAVLHTCLELALQAQIIHCNDWHTGLIPFLLKTHYADVDFFHQTRSIFTVHNAAFQGTYARSQLWMIPEINNHFIGKIQQEHNDINLLKCGVLYADKITAVSPNYAAELLTDLGAHGVASAFRERRDDLCGVLNGCDYRCWDPQHDPLISHNYDIHHLHNKSQCKKFLQQSIGLPVSNVPMYGIVCRLTEQKGVHLLIPALQQFLTHQVHVVVMGTGDPAFAGQLHALAAHFPEKLAFINAYTEQQAHQIEAGCDFFLMPSLFEPCGLNQIYSLAYGTLPIVRDVGGLRDTVNDYDQDPSCATGFVFQQPDYTHLLNTMRRSLIFYLQEPKELQRVRKNAMHVKFLWSTAVAHYLHVYQSAQVDTLGYIPDV